MFYDVTVTEVKTNELSGFSVTALYRAPFEDMFERITHPAVFADRHQANRFSDKVRNNLRAIKFSNWILPTDVTSYIRNEKNPERYFVKN